MSKFTDLFGGVSKEELHEFSMKMQAKLAEQMKIITIETDDGEIIELDIDGEPANDNDSL
jgi:hypothetical protein